MTTLYHLVSNQVWQNLLPILAYRPKKVVQIRSKGEEWKRSEDNLVEAVYHYLGSRDIEFDTIPLQNDFPAIDEVQEILTRRHKSCPADIVNFTGGTKLISIGTYRFAQEHHIPSFYYDSRYGDFDGKTGVLPDKYAEYAEVAKRIKVVVALAAHGYSLERNGYESKMDSKMVSYAEKVCRIMTEHPSAINRWLNKCSEKLCNKNGKWFPDFKLRDILRSPLPSAESDAVEEFMGYSEEVGLLRADLSGAFRLDSNPSAARKHFQIMQGGWWELYVTNHYKNEGRYSDVIWNVVGEGETDVLAFDQESLSVAVISCKSGRVQKPLEHVESLTKRAEKMGGRYARSVLAVREEPSAELIEHCTKNKVRLLFGPDLQDAKELNREKH